MTIWVFRLVLILGLGGIGYHLGSLEFGPGGGTYPQYGILIGVGAAVVVCVGETVLGKRPIQSSSSIVFGVIVGCIVAFMLYGVVHLLIGPTTHETFGFPDQQTLKSTILLVLVMVCCYLGVAIIYRTRDQFSFVIPYVEFRREAKSVRPLLLDTSAIVDGRVGEICRTGALEGPLLVPKFVLQELHTLADSADGIRRRRGRRGLDMLYRLQRDEHVDIQLHDGRPASGTDVDAKILSLASSLAGSIVTTDYNLTKVAELQGIKAVNLNEMANALRPIALPGEELEVKVIRAGDEPGQGVGFLPDGTMVVLERGKERIGQNVRFTVTSILQTSAGRMVFGKPREDAVKTRQ